MNAINVIQPYYNGTWVFDDPRVGLQAEPFVAGIDTMLDQVTGLIPDARNGFILIFSASPFPGNQYRLEWSRAEYGGNIYHSEELGAEGWLCPALLRYFDQPPREIYIQIKARPV